MTAHKKSEEDLKRSNDLLTESNRELEAFSYTAAHDLRAPLRHMHGFVSLLRKDWYDKLDEDGRHYLDKISTSSKDMGALLDDLLDFSRLVSVNMQQHRIDLNQEVKLIRQELEADSSGRDLTWEIGDLPEVEGDPTLLHQVLFNLIANAVKYTRKRENARIEIGSLDSPENFTTVFVRDNGAGFEMQYLNKLFRVFQRLHKARDFEGTGIGLAIVRRIVERHGGQAWAEGALDQGATFYFSLPKITVQDSSRDNHG
jgi:light-regulated signal transduction histidine kinase (bacteriophytochrome)